METLGLSDRIVHLRTRLAVLSAAFSLLLAGCGGPPGETQATGEIPAQMTGATDTTAVGETQLQRQTYGDCTIELKAAIPYSHRIYGIFGLTAPEDVDLSRLLKPGREVQLSLEGLSGEVADGSGPRQDAYVNVSWEVAEDGDGRENTVDVVVQAVPVTAQGEEGPFGPGNVCRICFEDLVLSDSDGTRTSLAPGDWQFALDLSVADTEAVELLDGPVAVQALVLRTGETEADAPEAVEPVTLTSVRLDPLGVRIVFQKPEPVQTLLSVFLDGASSASAAELEKAYVLMEDGRQIGLFQAQGGVDSAELQADNPHRPKPGRVPASPGRHPGAHRTIKQKSPFPRENGQLCIDISRGKCYAYFGT